MKSLEERVRDVIALLDKRADEWRKRREGLDDNHTPRMAGMCTGMVSAYEAAGLMLEVELANHKKTA